MQQALIDYYKAIEDSSRKMLEAAQAKDWDGMVRYESACAVLIEQLRFQGEQQELLPEHRKEKMPRSAPWPSLGWRSLSTCLTASRW